MQMILIVIITILILAVIYQGNRIRKLEEKTLEALHIVCNYLKKER